MSFRFSQSCLGNFVKELNYEKGLIIENCKVREIDQPDTCRLDFPSEHTANMNAKVRNEVTFLLLV